MWFLMHAMQYCAGFCKSFENLINCNIYIAGVNENTLKIKTPDLVVVFFLLPIHLIALHASPV